MDRLTIVSGLPRSGTSLLMRMLDVGGMEVLRDDSRPPDPHNPDGYYELDRVRHLPYGDVDWLNDAEGRAVKVVAPLVRWLPPGPRYRILFMERDLNEILASQKRMLDRGARGAEPSDAEASLRSAFRRELERTDRWLEERADLEVHRVPHRRLVLQPERELPPLIEFLGTPLDLERMAEVSDPTLYRSRSL